MQTSDSRSKSNKVAGVAVVAGFVLFSSSAFIACQPGEVDCESVTAPKYCDGQPAGGSGGGEGGSGGSGEGGRAGGNAGSGGRAGGSAGTTGGTGGGMGGMAGGSGGGPTAATAVPGCEMAKTVGEVETKIIKMKCGLCHTAAGGTAFPTDLSTADVYKRIVDAAPKGAYCKTSAKVVDKAMKSNSLLLLKLAAKPMCPDGAAAGTQMPAGGLTAAESACLTSYVDVITK